MLHVCKFCKKSFCSTRKKRVHCSLKCLNDEREQNRWQFGKCANCGNPIKRVKWRRPRSIKKENNRMFCSVKCRVIFQRRDKASSYKGGEYIDKIRGWIMVCQNKEGERMRTYRAKQRIVIEEFLGRTLKRRESVLFINGIRTDIRIDNLYLFPTMSDMKKIYHRGPHPTQTNLHHIKEIENLVTK